MSADTGPAVSPNGVLTSLCKEARYLENVSKRRALAHRDTCNFWNAANYWLGIPAAIAATIAGSTAFPSFSGHTIVAGAFALIAALLTSLATFLKPSQIARLHQNAATRYGDLEGDFRRFAAIDTVLEQDPKTLRDELKQLVKTFDGVDAASPPLPRWYSRRYKATPAGPKQRA